MRPILAALGVAALAAATALPVAEARAKPAQTAQPAQKQPHRVVIQVTQNDPVMMNTALNNAENLVKYYESKGEKVEVEFVAYGPGLAMVRSDTSPVKDRIASIAGSMKNVTFSGCENTMAVQSKAENKQVTLLSDAKGVPTGIGRIVELQEHGWTYVRP
jgi:intracellular sulfur oxidation DsrE/DsrF family protein